MKKILLCLLCLTFLVMGCKKSDAVVFKEEYESLNGEETSSGKIYPSISISEDNIIKYSNLEEVLDILDKGTGVIYLGFPTCPWCRNMIPVLFEAADSTDLQTIYYVNMLELRDKKTLDENNEIKTEEGDPLYPDLLAKLDSILPDYVLTDIDGNTYPTGEKRLYVPTVLFVYEGELVGYHFNTVESQTDPYVLLDDNQKEELYNIYIDNIHKVLNDLCVEDSEGC